ncbi:MAG: tripartite tricarboxylate transporter TctB family protein [Burkholderiaceae bacterium]|nr:tripartite tricarboxylate transporter TctB family protein [Burkholderiaceae bacterium]
MKSKNSWRGLITPLAFVIIALVLRHYVVESQKLAALVTRGLAGPSTWPDMMLWVIIFFSAVWALQTAVVIIRSRIPTIKPIHATQVSSSDAESTPFSLLIALGVLFILLYGYLLAVIGFATATLLYIVSWCWLGGVRKPLLVSLIGLIGTTVLLYLFVKLASMPLDRGQGVMGDFSIMLYRFMGIY